MMLKVQKADASLRSSSAFCFFLSIHFLNDMFHWNPMKNVHLSINVSPLRTTAEIHHHDTTEDHEGGKNLLPTEGVHAQADADGGGDDGLHVGVHAD